MSELLIRPQECVDANCVAMCSPIDYDFLKRGFGNDARKCLNYKNGLSEKHYKQGLNDAWECARKIWNMRADEVIAVFGGCSMWVNYTASEAMKMIKEYEESKQ